MNETEVTGLREELAVLEAEEQLLSAERNRLHQQIDNGFATEMSRERELELSCRRRELHRKIDAYRECLGLPAGPRRRSDEGGLEKVFSFGSGA